MLTEPISFMGNRIPCYRVSTGVCAEGHTSKEEYDHRRREIQERLEALRIPEVDASIVAGTLLEELGRLW